MILDRSNIRGGHAVRRHLCFVGRANDGAGSLRLEQPIGPCGAPIVAFGLRSVEVGKRFRRGGQSLQFVQMLCHDVAQQAVYLGRSQMASQHARRPSRPPPIWHRAGPPDVARNWDRVFASSGTDGVYETSWRARSEDVVASSTWLFFDRDELRLTRSLREWNQNPPSWNFALSA